MAQCTHLPGRPARRAAVWLVAGLALAGLAAPAITARAQDVDTLRSQLLALDAEGAFDPGVALAFVDRVFESQAADAYPLATQAYAGLLRYPGPMPDSLQAPLAPYCEALHLLLPEWVPAATCLPLSTAIAESVAAWWRRRDPQPASLHNEFLEEHLRRIAHARVAYRDAEGYDDRGQVYIRLGAPDYQTHVNFDATEFRNHVMDRSLTINASDFPANEFWYYARIDPSAQFIFHDTGGRFRLGDVQSLIPTSVRSGLGNSARGRQKAKAMMWTLEQIYQQLSLYNEAYATRYTDVAAFAGMIEEAENAAAVERAFGSEREDIDSEGSDPVRRAINDSRANPADVSLPGGSFNLNRPDLYIQHALSEARASDEMIAAHREDRVPAYRSQSLDELAPLPVRARSARFLDADGSTRTEIYWGIPAGGLELEPATQRRLEDEGFMSPDLLVVASLIQQTDDYRSRAIQYSRLAVPHAGAETGALPARMLTAPGDTGRYHLAVQWDLLAAYVGRGETPLETGPRVKTNVLRIDSLTALSADPRRLEMSDIKPLLALDPAGEPALFPGAQLAPEAPLVLYFEVYHLAYDGDDRTRYTVAYEVVQQPGGLFRRRGERTAFSASFAGEERTAREQLALDLSDWRGRGTVDIVVRVTDDVTGQSVSRSLSYELTGD
ncbi:MAG: GWxTD domain-containing protein [Rhodothermales bacterium]